MSIGVHMSISILVSSVCVPSSGIVTGLILQSEGLSRFFSSTTVQKHQFFSAQSSLWSNSLYVTTGKDILLTIRTFVGKVMSLLFNKLSRFVLNEYHGIWSHHFMANGETMEIMTDFIFLGSKITSDDACSHEIKRCWLLRRKGENRLY